MKTDPILEDAIRRRDKAQAEVDQWANFIRIYEELGKSVGRLTDMTQRILADDRRVSLRHASRVGERGIATEQAALDLIAEKNRPIPTKEMVSLFQEKGIEVGGQDPVATLHARLSRSPKLKFDRPYGWRPVEPRQEIGPAGTPSPEEPAASDQQTTSSHVEPMAGGGT